MEKIFVCKTTQISVGQMKKISNGRTVKCSLHSYTFPVPKGMKNNWNSFIDEYWQ